MGRWLSSLAGGQELFAHVRVARVRRADNNPVELFHDLLIGDHLLARAVDRHALVPLAQLCLRLERQVQERRCPRLLAALRTVTDS